MSQIISILVTPLPILKMLIPENNFFYEKQAVKHQILMLLLKMTSSVQNYLKRAADWDNIDLKTLSVLLANQISRNFPDAVTVLHEWDRISDESDECARCTIDEYLESVFDLFETYQVLAPSLLDSCNQKFDLKQFLGKTELSNKIINVKIIKFFVTLNPELFLIKSDSFEMVLKTTFQLYYQSPRDLLAFDVLRVILQNSGIFDDFEHEIPIWIDGVLNIKHFDGNIDFLIDLIKICQEKGAEYDKKNYEMKAEFSPMLLGLNDYFKNHVSHKLLKNYLNFVILNLFHIQNDCNNFNKIVFNLDCLAPDLLSYIKNWSEKQVTILKSLKGCVLKSFHEFSVCILENGFSEFNFDPNSNLILYFLHCMVFYLNNLKRADVLCEKHVSNCQNFLDFLTSNKTFRNEKFITEIFRNKLFLNNFEVLKPNDLLTNFILDLIKKFKSSNYKIEPHLFDFREKIVGTLCKVFKNPQNFQNVIITSPEIFDLNYTQSVQLIENVIENDGNSVFYDIVCYCLNQISCLVKKDYSLPPLSDGVFKKITQMFVVLIKNLSSVEIFSRSLLNYLKVFPHNLKALDEVDLFESLILMPEYNRDNLLLAQFLLGHKTDFFDCFIKNLDVICGKKGFILGLLDVVVEHNDLNLMETIYAKIENQIIKALQKPHKAGPHFQKHYQNVSFLIKKCMKKSCFSDQIHKFETTELFHVYLLNEVFQLNQQKTDKQIMTFIHLILNLLKMKGSDKQIENFNEISSIFFNFLDEIPSDLNFVNNETFKLFCKLCLKYGVGNDVVLLSILSKLVIFLSEDDAKLILDMLLSHSLFFDVVLGDFHKTELVELWMVLCERWPHFMERGHVPIILSAYRATQQDSDKIILGLLKK